MAFQRVYQQLKSPSTSYYTVYQNTRNYLFTIKSFDSTPSYGNYRFTSDQYRFIQSGMVVSSGGIRFCNNITNLEIQVWNSRVLNNEYCLYGMFSDCNKFNGQFYYDRFITGTTDVRYMFSGCEKFTNGNCIPVYAKYYDYFYYNCKSLTSVNIYLSENAESIAYICSGCENLTSVSRTLYKNLYNYSHAFENTISIDMSFYMPDRTADEVNNMTQADCSYMFANSATWSSIPVRNYVKNAAYMFYNCTRLRQTDISGMNPYALGNIDYMFYNCGKITHWPSTVKIYYLNTLNYAFAKTNFQNTNFLNYYPNDLKYAIGAFSDCPNLKYVNIPFGNNIVNLQNLFLGSPNVYGNIYILNTKLAQANVRNLVGSSRNTYQSINIYCTNITVIKGGAASNSVIGASISWASTTNGFYNALYNIYIFNKNVPTSFM